MFPKLQIVTTTFAVAIGLATAAKAADGLDADSSAEGNRSASRLALVALPGASFERSIETHTLRVSYRDLFGAAAKLGVEPAHDLLSERAATGPELDRAITELKPKVAQARKREQAEPDFGSVAGVSQSTLDAIAACESGGDPAAVNAAGYYGKYQFDAGTWASVGGSGNPAEAPEAEQDYRAALLYSRAGSSPWPVCGL